MIPGREEYKNLSEIAASGVPEASHVLDGGEWVIRLIAYRQETHGSGAADERTRCLSFNDVMQLRRAEWKLISFHHLF